MARQPRAQEFDATTLVGSIVTRTTCSEVLYVHSASPRIITASCVRTGINKVGTLAQLLAGPGALVALNAPSKENTLQFQGRLHRVHEVLVELETPDMKPTPPVAVLEDVHGMAQVTWEILFEEGALTTMQLGDDETDQESPVYSSGEEEFPAPAPRREPRVGEAGWAACKLLLSHATSDVERVRLLRALLARLQVAETGVQLIPTEVFELFACDGAYEQPEDSLSLFLAAALDEMITALRSTAEAEFATDTDGTLSAVAILDAALEKLRRRSLMASRGYSIAATSRLSELAQKEAALAAGGPHGAVTLPPLPAKHAPWSSLASPLGSEDKMGTATGFASDPLSDLFPVDTNAGKAVPMYDTLGKAVPAREATESQSSSTSGEATTPPKAQQEVLLGGQTVRVVDISDFSDSPRAIRSSEGDSLLPARLKIALWAASEPVAGDFPPTFDMDGVYTFEAVAGLTPPTVHGPSFVSAYTAAAEQLLAYSYEELGLCGNDQALLATRDGPLGVRMLVAGLTMALVEKYASAFDTPDDPHDGVTFARMGEPPALMDIEDLGGAKQFPWLTTLFHGRIPYGAALREAFDAYFSVWDISFGPLVTSNPERFLCREWEEHLSASLPSSGITELIVLRDSDRDPLFVAQFAHEVRMAGCARDADTPYSRGTETRALRLPVMTGEDGVAFILHPVMAAAASAGKSGAVQRCYAASAILNFIQPSVWGFAMAWVLNEIVRRDAGGSGSDSAEGIVSCLPDLTPATLLIRFDTFFNGLWVSSPRGSIAHWRAADGPGLGGLETIVEQAVEIVRGTVSPVLRELSQSYDNAARDFRSVSPGPPPSLPPSPPTGPSPPPELEADADNRGEAAATDAVRQRALHAATQPSRRARQPGSQAEPCTPAALPSAFPPSQLCVPCHQRSQERPLAGPSPLPEFELEELGFDEVAAAAPAPPLASASLLCSEEMEIDESIEPGEIVLADMGDMYDLTTGSGALALAPPAGLLAPSPNPSPPAPSTPSADAPRRAARLNPGIALGGALPEGEATVPPAPPPTPTAPLAPSVAPSRTLFPVEAGRVMELLNAPTIDPASFFGEERLPFVRELLVHPTLHTAEAVDLAVAALAPLDAAAERLRSRGPSVALSERVAALDGALSRVMRRNDLEAPATLRPSLASVQALANVLASVQAQDAARRQVRQRIDDGTGDAAIEEVGAGLEPHADALVRRDARLAALPAAAARAREAVQAQRRQRLPFPSPASESIFGVTNPPTGSLHPQRLGAQLGPADTPRPSPAPPFVHQSPCGAVPPLASGLGQPTAQPSLGGRSLPFAGFPMRDVMRDMTNAPAAAANPLGAEVLMQQLSEALEPAAAAEPAWREYVGSTAQLQAPLRRTAPAPVAGVDGRPAATPEEVAAALATINREWRRRAAATNGPHGPPPPPSGLGVPAPPPHVPGVPPGAALAFMHGIGAPPSLVRDGGAAAAAAAAPASLSSAWHVVHPSRLHAPHPGASDYLDTTGAFAVFDALCKAPTEKLPEFVAQCPQAVFQIGWGSSEIAGGKLITKPRPPPLPDHCRTARAHATPATCACSAIRLLSRLGFVLFAARSPSRARVQPALGMMARWGSSDHP